VSLSLSVYRKVAGVSDGVISLFPDSRRQEWSGGWLVDNDFPLPNMGEAEELIAATQGFALVLPDGEIVGEFKTASEADEARSGARISFKADVEQPSPVRGRA
jgi:hypothetical protein